MDAVGKEKWTPGELVRGKAWNDVLRDGQVKRSMTALTRHQITIMPLNCGFVS